MTDRIDRLEQTILDMGSEIFRLRHSIETMEDTQTCLIEFINNLKSVLIEGGFLNEDDFDAMSDPKILRDLLDPLNDLELDQYTEEALKKASH